jgi:hypothetical protein
MKTAHRGTGDNAAVRAELDEWVAALSETVERLYAEIDRIRRGDLKPKGGPDAADRGTQGFR